MKIIRECDAIRQLSGRNVDLFLWLKINLEVRVYG